MAAAERPTDQDFATVGQRVAAHVVDTTLASVVVFPFAVLLLKTQAWWALCLSGLVFLITMIYRFAGDGIFHGQSLGKALLDIRVVSAATLAPCTPLQSVLRNSFFILPFMPLVDLIVLAVDGQERWGDKAVGTWVLKAHPAKEATAQAGRPIDFTGLQEQLRDLPNHHGKEETRD